MFQGEHIEIPYTRIQASTTFPDNIKNEIYLAFFSAQGWDATWKCEDSLFKVHKFVLALFSPYLRVSISTQIIGRRGSETF